MPIDAEHLPAVVGYCSRLCDTDGLVAAIVAADKAVSTSQDASALLGATRRSAIEHARTPTGPSTGRLRHRLAGIARSASSTCQHVPVMLTAKAEGQLSSHDNAVLDGHLARCRACRGLAARMVEAEQVYWELVRNPVFAARATTAAASPSSPPPATSAVPPPRLEGPLASSSPSNGLPESQALEQGREAQQPLSPLLPEFGSPSSNDVAGPTRAGDEAEAWLPERFRQSGPDPTGVGRRHEHDGEQWTPEEGTSPPASTETEPDNPATSPATSGLTSEWAAPFLGSSSPSDRSDESIPTSPPEPVEVTREPVEVTPNSWRNKLSRRIRTRIGRS